LRNYAGLTLFFGNLGFRFVCHSPFTSFIRFYGFIVNIKFKTDGIVFFVEFFALSGGMKIEGIIFISKAERNNIRAVFIGHCQPAYHGSADDRFDFGVIGNLFVFSSHCSGLMLLIRYDFDVCFLVGRHDKINLVLTRTASPYIDNNTTFCQICYILSPVGSIIY
jgi:hypothetical protein